MTIDRKLYKNHLVVPVVPKPPCILGPGGQVVLYMCCYLNTFNVCYLDELFYVLLLIGKKTVFYTAGSVSKFPIE